MSDGLQGNVSQTFLIEVLAWGDSCRSDVKFCPAIKKELEGLERGEIWTIVENKNVPKDANIVGRRFVYGIKN